MKHPLSLMFGNLVCFALDKHFKQLLWGTVAQKSEAVLVECEDTTAAMLKFMFAGNVIAVESPAYFRAYVVIK